MAGSSLNSPELTKSPSWLPPLTSHSSTACRIISSVCDGTAESVGSHCFSSGSPTVDPPTILHSATLKQSENSCIRGIAAVACCPSGTVVCAAGVDRLVHVWRHGRAEESFMSRSGSKGEPRHIISGKTGAYPSVESVEMNYR